MLFRKKASRGNVYAGEIVVVPRSGLRNVVSNLAPALDRKIDGVVESTLLQLLDCPAKSSRTSTRANDLALDVVIPEHNYGEFMLPHWEGHFAPLVWRPSITVTGRLYLIESGETVSRATVKHSVSWSLWGKKIASLPKLLRFQSYMSDADMERLTTEAVVKFLSKL